MRRFIPKFAFSAYHFLLSFLGAAFYGWPSRKMTVIGVTGTKGKTTTSNLIAQLLEQAGHRVGLATTVNFKIGEKDWINSAKQTMLGRFRLQKLLREMLLAKCRYAVVETSSEGILQHRHRFIDYDAVVFTNLSPEHIERHGCFEKYRQAKEKLFAQAARKKNGIGVYNLDDPCVEHFLKYEVKNKYGYFQDPANAQAAITDKFQISKIALEKDGTEFELNGQKFKTALIGEMNVYNVVSALCVAAALGLEWSKLPALAAKLTAPSGRMQLINRGQAFTVIVDYAHEPSSLKAAYQTARLFRPRRIIGILGAQGGGRDRGKRARLGEIAGQYADYVFVTNEDPYDEDPWRIINDVAQGVSGKPAEKILDRTKAIEAALKLARPDDLVLITGKGGEVSMCVENGKKLPCSDEKTVKEILDNFGQDKK